jgi:uncharacterized membrane protein YfcA
LTVLEFTLLVAIGALFAGLIGALTGLGGGVVLLPLLTLVFGVDIKYAIGATLVSVIATSSGAAAAYVKEGYSNIRIGMFLEVATTLGAIGGAFLAEEVSTSAIAVIFGVVLLVSMNSTYPTPEGVQAYYVRGVPLGWVVMFIAGLLSGLLGIGSGALKVLALDQVMKLPFKVSTTTSNFMIGVTAAASAGIYLRRGQIDPGLAMPVMLGVLAGAMLGARLLVLANVRVLRIIFSIVIVALAIEMIYHGVMGNVR